MEKIRNEVRARAEVRKWGHSLGIILPRELVKKHGIIERQIVELCIEKRSNIRQLFGSLKITTPTQEIKKHLKKEWKE